MSGSLSRVTLIGHLSDQPEIITTDDGKEVASFTVATSEKWTDMITGKEKQVTYWHRVIVFNESLIATLKDFCQKGTRLLLEGTLRTRRQQGQDEKDQFITEIIIPITGGKLLLLD